LEEVEVSAAIHLAFDELQFADLAFGLAVGLRQGDCRLNRCFVFGHPVGERGDKAAARASVREIHSEIVDRASITTGSNDP
jgi:hypothetical protein